MIRRVAVIVVLVFGSVAAVSACPVCVGDTDSKMVQGTNNAILFMLAMVGVVQACLVALFVSVRRRSKALDRRLDRFQLIEGGTR